MIVYRVVTKKAELKAKIGLFTSERSLIVLKTDLIDQSPTPLPCEVL